MLQECEAGPGPDTSCHGLARRLALLEAFVAETEAAVAEPRYRREAFGGVRTPHTGEAMAGTPDTRWSSSTHGIPLEAPVETAEEIEHANCSIETAFLSELRQPAAPVGPEVGRPGNLDAVAYHNRELEMSSRLAMMKDTLSGNLTELGRLKAKRYLAKTASSVASNQVDRLWQSQPPCPAPQALDSTPARNEPIAAGADQVAATERGGIQTDAESVFRLLAGLTPDDESTISKLELIKAHHGDFKLFEQLDVDSDGRITIDEWHRFLQSKHVEMGGKGDAWLRSLLHTLRQNIKQGDSDRSHEGRTLPEDQSVLEATAAAPDSTAP